MEAHTLLTEEIDNVVTQHQCFVRLYENKLDNHAIHIRTMRCPPPYTPSTTTPPGWISIQPSNENMPQDMAKAIDAAKARAVKNYSPDQIIVTKVWAAFKRPVNESEYRYNSRVTHHVVLEMISFGESYTHLQWCGYAIVHSSTSSPPGDFQVDSTRCHTA